MYYSNVTSIDDRFRLVINCPHCNKETKTEYELMGIKWMCSKHGVMFSFFGSTMFETEASLLLRNKK